MILSGNMLFSSCMASLSTLLTPPLIRCVIQLQADTTTSLHDMWSHCKQNKAPGLPVSSLSPLA